MGGRLDPTAHGGRLNLVCLQNRLNLDRNGKPRPYTDGENWHCPGVPLVLPCAVTLFATNTSPQAI